MTLAESTLVRDLRDAFRRKLEVEYALIRRNYTMFSGTRIAHELGIVAMRWGWTLCDQAMERRIRQAEED